MTDVLKAIADDDLVPVTVQARVVQSDVVHAPEPPPLDRLEHEGAPRTPEDRFVAEGKLWCHRDDVPLPTTRLGGPKVYVPLSTAPPSLPASANHGVRDDGGSDE